MTNSAQPWERMKDYRTAEIADENLPMPHFPDALNSWLLAGLKEKKKKQSENLTIACLIFLPYLMKKQDRSFNS